MKIFWLIGLALFEVITSQFPQEFNMVEMRELLSSAVNSKENSNKLFDKIGNYSGQDPVLISYKAAAHAVKAKHATNPLKKLKLIKASARLFDDAVQQNDQSLEIRFVRYAVESQTPARVNLSKHLEEDKNFLLQAIREYPRSGAPPDLAILARDFLKQYCTCSEEEKRDLDKMKLNKNSQQN